MYVSHSVTVFVLPVSTVIWVKEYNILKYNLSNSNWPLWLWNRMPHGPVEQKPHHHVPLLKPGAVEYSQMLLLHLDRLLAWVIAELCLLFPVELICVEVSDHPEHRDEECQGGTNLSKYLVKRYNYSTTYSILYIYVRTKSYWKLSVPTQPIILSV